jgi:histidine triad (HIT) family protein
LKKSACSDYLVLMELVTEEHCLFCQIIRREKPAEIVYEDAVVTAFKDKYPHAPVHLLIVPRKHIRSINDLTAEDLGIVSAMIFKAKDLALEFGVSQTGYRLSFNVERGAGQVIWHLHLHLTGGWA